jgi:hypothetical protein
METSLWESWPEFWSRAFTQAQSLLTGLLALIVTVSLAVWLGTDSVPPKVGAGFVVAAVVLACYRAFHEVRMEREQREVRIATLTTARPALRCVGQKFVSLSNKDGYRFHALQVWICNEPENRSGPDTMARDVSVRVSFFRPGDAQPFRALVSQWVRAFDPEAASYVGQTDITDIPASDVPAKFFLVLQHPAMDDDCYIHTFSTHLGQPDGRAANNRLAPGAYRVVLHFRGANLDQEMELRFVNNGRASAPELAGIPVKGDGGPQPSHAAGPETCPTCGQFVRGEGLQVR